MRTLFLASLAAAALTAAELYPVPQFTDPSRREKLLSALPEVDAMFQRYAKDRKIPGMVWGVVLDGALVHTGTAGVQDRETSRPVTENSVFRIASMTKSFTALAILKLRDSGKLSLEDPVSRWIPEFARMEMPSGDAGVLRVRHLMTHTAGFAEDNPWGDQQLGASDAELSRWLAQGLPWSTAPGMEYEYSNYGFALLGRIVAKASGVPYRTYLQREILMPLGMKASTLESSTVPGTVRVTGYRLKPDGTHAVEPSLPDGAFGPMGGLLTSAADLGRYVAYQLSAWPPRDERDPGPVRRSSLREMQQIHHIEKLTAVARPSGGRADVTGYGYGLRIFRDCRFAHVAGHGGGLPGFGSYMMWLPEYGIGMFMMANLTYSGASGLINQSWDVFRKTGGLQKRTLPPSKLLTGTRDSIVRLWRNWDEAEAEKLAAVNLFRDIPAAERRRRMEALRSEVGACTPGDVTPANWLRGQFPMRCEKGNVTVTFTLAPTQPPGVQYLEFERAASASAPEPPSGSDCRLAASLAAGGR